MIDIRRAAILGMALLAQGCLDAPVGPAGGPLSTACAVPRLAATPDPPKRANAPGNPPAPVLTAAELTGLADCVRPALAAAMRDSEAPAARAYASWPRYSSRPFGSEHGSYLEIFANDKASAFGRFEDAGVLPDCAIVVKHHFSVSGTGAVSRGPLLTMQKMQPGFNPPTADWRFTMITPDGKIAGETAGRNATAVDFCLECHKAAWRQDFLMFVPPEFRRMP
jgi:hypothetical protein